MHFLGGFNSSETSELGVYHADIEKTNNGTLSTDKTVSMCEIGWKSDQT